MKLKMHIELETTHTLAKQPRGQWRWSPVEPVCTCSPDFLRGFVFMGVSILILCFHSPDNSLASRLLLLGGA